MAPYEMLWTEQARRVIAQSHKEARSRGSSRIDTGHLFLALTQNNESVVVQVLQEMEIALEDVRAAVKARIHADHAVAASTSKFTPRAKHAFKLAWREAQQLGHKYIGPEHILFVLLPGRKMSILDRKISVLERLWNLGRLPEEDDPITNILGNAGLNLDQVRHQVLRYLGYPEK